MMPREIDCPDCGGSCRSDIGMESVYASKYPCQNCKDGKITVYTEEELQEAIKQNNEECASICENERDKNTGYVFLSAERCAEAIRLRSNE